MKSFYVSLFLVLGFSTANASESLLKSCHTYTKDPVLQVEVFEDGGYVRAVVTEGGREINTFHNLKYSKTSGFNPMPMWSDGKGFELKSDAAYPTAAFVKFFQNGRVREANLECHYN